MAKFTGHPITDDSALGGSIINGSLKFNGDDTQWLSRTPSSASNRRTFTWSGWVKRSQLDASNNAHVFFDSRDSSSQTIECTFGFLTNNHFYLDTTSGGRIRTTAQFRDVNAWQHWVIAVDTTQATSSNRVKIYINGVQVTSFAQENYPSQNYETSINAQYGHSIGRYNSGGHYDGYMSEIHFIDGSQLDPTYFGYTDSQTGLWRPKKYTYGNYGTNGFYLPLDNSVAIGSDKSGNGNDFSNNNAAVDLVSDSPSGIAVQRQPEDNPTGSVVFDGDSDHLTITDNGDLNFGSNDWTIECFLYARNLGGSPDGDSYERHYPIIQKGNSASNYIMEIILVVVTLCTYILIHQQPPVTSPTLMP